MGAEVENNQLDAIITVAIQAVAAKSCLDHGQADSEGARQRRLGFSLAICQLEKILRGFPLKPQRQILKLFVHSGMAYTGMGPVDVP